MEGKVLSVLRGPDGELYGIAGGEVGAIRIPTGRSEERQAASVGQRSAARVAIEDTAAFFCGYRIEDTAAFFCGYRNS